MELKVKHTAALDKISAEDFKPIDVIGFSEDGELIHGTLTRRSVYIYELVQHCPTEYDSYNIPGVNVDLKKYIDCNDIIKILK